VRLLALEGRHVLTERAEPVRELLVLPVELADPLLERTPLLRLGVQLRLELARSRVRVVEILLRGAAGAQRREEQNGRKIRHRESHRSSTSRQGLLRPGSWVSFGVEP